MGFFTFVANISDMYDVVSIFQGSYNLYGYETWESNLESFFSYFALTSEQKCHYARMKLVEEPYYWVNDNYKFCRCWSRLQSFFVLGMLHVFFIHIAKSPMLRKSPTTDQLLIYALSFGRAREICSKLGCKD